MLKMCLFSERLFMEMADRMAEDGFKEAGYEYVSIDVSYPLNGKICHCFNNKIRCVFIVKYSSMHMDG